MTAELSFLNITPSEMGEEYWRRTATHKLPLLRCSSCGKPRRYLTRVCYACRSTKFEWVSAKGTGSVYAFTEIYYPPTNEYKTPYILALVDLDEGVRMMCNILDAKASDLRIGSRVKVTFQELPDGKSLPQFVLAPNEISPPQRAPYGY